MDVDWLEQRGDMASEAGESGIGDEVNERRDRLLEIAIELISEEGLRACTFRRLAERAGGSTRIFTYEFENRSNLLRAVHDHLWEIVWPNWQEIGDPNDLEDPLLTYYEICLNEIEDEYIHHNNAYFELLRESAFDPEIAGWVAEMDREMFGRLSALVAAAQRKGQLPADLDPGEVVSTFWALEDGLKIGRLNYPDYFGAERTRRIFETTFDAVLGLPAQKDGSRPTRDP